MPPDELAVSFPCGDEWLTGILSRPTGTIPRAKRGVLIVVGGPQYRVGSHRQFVLLARSLAASGIAAFRFDYRGMGDSTGAARDYTAIDSDLRAAVDQFFHHVPTMEEVVMWGLCDGASAALFYAGQDPRIAGLVLLNPWARTESSLAGTTLKHYYRARLLQPELWKKLLGGRFDWRAAATGFFRLARAALQGRSAAGKSAAAKGSLSAAGSSVPGLHERMWQGMQAFRGKVLLIISGNDLTAKEFLDMANASGSWRRTLSSARVRQHTLKQADHTFSRREWRDQVAGWTADWVRSW